MPRRVSVSVLAILLACPAAFAQNITINGLARSASLMEALRRNCDNVNGDIARRYQSAFTEVGRKTFGAATFDEELTRELPRRLNEVREQGVQRWCAVQTVQQKKNGATDLFND